MSSSKSKTGLIILRDVAILREMRAEEERYWGAHRNCKTATKFGAVTVVGNCPGKSTVFVNDRVPVMPLVLVELLTVLICSHLVSGSILDARTWYAAWSVLSFPL